MNKLDSIKKACKITDKVYSNVLKNFSRFHSEKDVERFIRNEFKKLRVKPAFPPIVSIGKLPYPKSIHHKPENRWQKGFCIIDMGAKYNGYCSDMTRMVYIGKPTKYELKFYNFLKQVQENDIKHVKPGMTNKELALFNKKQLKSYFEHQYHSLGHGVSKLIHDKPRLSMRKKVPVQTLNKGDIITIEPGIYFSNKFGIRIEDTLEVGGKVLTKSSKKLSIFSD
ncbi:MAG: M24 family metallopeptidase [Candidatus Woesearchaeota archaeon]